MNRLVRLLPAAACALALSAAPALAAAHPGGGAHRGVVLSAAHRTVRIVDNHHRVTSLHVRSTRGLRRGEVVTVRGGRAHVVGHVSKVSFYGRVVKSTAHGALIRLADGSTFKLGAPHGAHAASTLTVSIEGLQPGQAVLITVSSDGQGNVAVTIQLVSGATNIGDSEQQASGYVTDDGDGSFAIRATDGSGLRFLDPQGLFDAADAQQCDTVDVTYHADGHRLIADGLKVTGQSTEGSCAPDAQGGDEIDGTVTAIAADLSSVTVDPGDGSGPQTIPVDDPTTLDGVTVGEQVAVLTDGNGVATEIDPLDGSGDQQSSGDGSSSDGSSTDSSSSTDG